MITTQDFLDILPIVQGQGWTVNEYGRIRNAKGQCPLCALADEIAGKPLGYRITHREVLREAGVTRCNSSAWNIVLAADAHEDDRGHYGQALARALGMTL